MLDSSSSDGFLEEAGSCDVLVRMSSLRCVPGRVFSDERGTEQILFGRKDSTYKAVNKRGSKRHIYGKIMDDADPFSIT